MLCFAYGTHRFHTARKEGAYLVMAGQGTHDDLAARPAVAVVVTVAKKEGDEPTRVALEDLRIKSKF